MGLKTRDSYKLQVETSLASTFRVATHDIRRMSADIRVRYPDAKVEQVGRRVSRASANKWVLGGER